jgi:hypothetical protein
MRGSLAIAACAVFAGTIVAARLPQRHETVIQLTSAPDGQQIEFEAHALGPDFRHSLDIERAVTPYTMRLPGDEVYVLFRQHGGTGLLRASVSPTRDRGTQVVAPVSMLVVRGGRSGAAMAQPFDHGVAR